MKSAARAVALAAMAGTLISPAVFADDTAKSPTTQNTNSAMRVIVDPETGEVRAPSSEELQAMIQAENVARSARSTARVAAPSTAPQVLPAEKSIQRHANGMLSVKLSQDSLSLVKASVDDQGKAQVKHDESHSTAEEK